MSLLHSIAVARFGVIKWSGFSITTMLQIAKECFRMQMQLRVRSNIFFFRIDVRLITYTAHWNYQVALRRTPCTVYTRWNRLRHSDDTNVTYNWVVYIWFVETGSLLCSSLNWIAERLLFPVRSDRELLVASVAIAIVQYIFFSICLIENDQTKTNQFHHYFFSFKSNVSWPGIPIQIWSVLAARCRCRRRRLPMQTTTMKWKRVRNEHRNK